MTKSDQVSLCDCDFVPLLSFMNYCRASFEIVTRIRQMAPLLYIINFRKLRLPVKNETTFISAKNRADLSSISKVRNYITEWPRFFWPTLYILMPMYAVSLLQCFSTGGSAEPKGSANGIEGFPRIES